MCAWYSARKYFSVVSGGVASASPNAHSVLPGDVVRHARQEIEIAHLAVAALNLREDLEQPVAALAARRALAARLVRVEVHQVHRRPHHAGRLVHDDHAGRAEHRARLLHGVEAGRDVELIGHQDRDRRSAGDDRLELVAVADAAGAIEDQLLDRRVHRRFVGAGLLHVAADAIELRPAVFLRSELGEPLRAVHQDRRQVAERLDVVDRRRAVVEARHAPGTAA